MFKSASDFLQNIDFKKLKLDPEALMLEFEPGAHPLRIFSTLLPSNVLSLNQLKTTQDADVYSNFALGPQYLHILPFLQASSHVMNMSICSFVDSLTAIKKSHDPLL